MDEGEPAKPLSRTERKKLQRLQREEAPHSQITRPRNWTEGAIKRVLDILGLIGGIAAVWSFFPAFAVSREPPLNPSDLLSGFFILRYESPIPVADVIPVCAINKLINDKGGGFKNLSMEKSSYRVDRMWQGDVVTVPCGSMMNSKLERFVKGDIIIIVLFRPILIPKFLNLRPWEKDFRFITMKQADGNLRWIPEPQDYHPGIIGDESTD